MTTLTGNYDKTYYYFALDLLTKEVVRIKNAGCNRAAEKLMINYLKLEDVPANCKRIKLFFHAVSPEPNLKYIPKKYHKYF